MSRVYCCRISSLGPREVFERPSACEGSCFAGEATLHWVVRQSGKGEVNFALVKFRKFYRRRVHRQNMSPHTRMVSRKPREDRD